MGTKYNSAGLETPGDVLAAIAASQQKPGPPTREQFAAKTAWSLASAVGLPIDAGGYILWLEGRILALEERLAKLEGPPHLQNVEKRA